MRNVLLVHACRGVYVGEILHPSQNATAASRDAAAAFQPLLRPHMPELDTLRGIAVLGVFLLHGFFWRYGNLHFARWQTILVDATQPGGLGVNLFFVLSGFLITGILLDSRNNPSYYRRFYVRRALRILPAYYALLLLLAVLGQASAAFLGLSFFYLANLNILFGMASDYGPLWSLAVEEHYYIFWPAVVRKLTQRQLAAVSFALCLLIPAGRAAYFLTGHTSGLGWYTWFVADGLAAGSLLGIFLRSGIDRKQAQWLCALLLIVSGSAGLAGKPFGILTQTRWLGAAFQHTLIAVFFTGILLLFLLAGSGPGKRYVNNAAMQFLGYISYGLYLMHLLIFRLYDKACRQFWPSLAPSDFHFGLVVLRFAVAGVIAVALAYLSRQYFEERFLKLKDKATTVRAEKTVVRPIPEAAPESAA